MNLMQKSLTILLLLTIFTGLAQDNLEKNNKEVLDSTKQVEYTSTYQVQIDTLKIDSTLIAGKNIALIDYQEASEFDKKWMESFVNSSIDSMLLVNPQDTIGKIVINSFSTELLKGRLADLDSKTPFHVEYNPSLEKIIKHYLKNRPETLANLMGRAKYYFPIFEEYLDKYNIPLELKYLAIVESALKPNAKSRVGAKGLWQFMYPTGKMYGLKVSSYVVIC